MHKKILGLDLGTNSIGWALIEQDDIERLGKILGSGSRILPMSQDVMGKFDSGQSISQTAERTGFRGIRRLRERHLLRRERLHRVLNILHFLPEHYAVQIDFDKQLGKFLEESEPKLPYRFNAETKSVEFIFQDSFEQMLSDFAKHQPEMVANGKKVPYDWTIYFLRKKALIEKIEKEELAWVLLNFNQKRGYYQLRGEEKEENTNKKVEFYSLRVANVEPTEDKKDDDRWYNIHLENGWIYRRSSKVPLEWTGKMKDFIVTTELNEDGSIKKDKEGKEKRSFRAPAEDDWTLLKKKTEHDIERSGKTVGTYIYDTLLQKPSQKIRGKLVRVVERKFYKQELEMILNNQKEFHPELRDENLYQACLEELYEYNESHKSSIADKGFTHLFVNDIIFYQRPLKSKKSLISNCPFESRTFIKEGKKINEPLKCISKSHPLFQEFRLWQFVQNLKIYQREKQVDGKLQTDVNVTSEFLKSEEEWVALFNWLNERKEVDQKAFLKYPAFGLKKNAEAYRWNYVEDKLYPCNETKAQIAARLSRVEGLPINFLDKGTEEALWHILYSVEDKLDIEKALNTFAKKKELLNETAKQFMEQFKKFPPFKKDYGAFSSKATKKLLSLMRAGNYWNEAAIDVKTKERVEKLMAGEWDESIKDRVRDKAIKLTQMDSFRGLPLRLASYIVYNRHSEAADIKKWKTANDIERLEQHSLRNPIVEQVINETLQVVKDIWKHYGNGKESFFNEIHVELGREMKNPATEREKISKKNIENEATNLRIKALLQELLNDVEIENVRPYSPMQQEILKVYEEGALMAAEEIPEYITKIAKQAQPSQSDLVRYKLWLQQKYRSPYTGEVIPLNKLFTRAYDIEHIIPQSRYFDDSLSNKVICEVEVNRDKDNSTAYEYIKNNRGKKIELSYGKEVTLFTIEQYEDFVKRHYSGSRSKMKKLLMEDIPEDFIQRQLNDSRYISKVVKGLLSNIVREQYEEEATSKNVIASNGAITSALKQDWGLNDVWNDIITPRFERLNTLTNSKNFGDWTNKEGKQVFQTAVPLELQKGFSKKRIDHRHHALDAIVIACASRSHINYLNNQSALEKGKSKEQREKLRYDLKSKLCFKKNNDDKNYKWIFHKPWESFTQDVRDTLENMVVSFKQNLRVVNKTANQYQRWEKDATGEMKKVLAKQTKGERWAIRKSLHTPMPYGKRNYDFDILKVAENIGKADLIINQNIKESAKAVLEKCNNKIKRAQEFLRTNPIKDENGNEINNAAFRFKTEKFRRRQPISKLSNRGQGGLKTFDDVIKFIDKVADYKIRQDLLLHLNKNENDIDKAFSAEGIEKFNETRSIPVYKLPIFESGTSRFAVGQKHNTQHKWVEADTGTNLFFAVYQDENCKRVFETVPLNEVVEHQKWRATLTKEEQKITPLIPIKSIKRQFLFSLSPNDLVYMPDEDERENLNNLNLNNLTKEQIKRIWVVNDFSSAIYFTPNHFSKSVAPKEVDLNRDEKNNKLKGSFDSKTASFKGVQIKEYCIKLQVNRLGHIINSVKLSLFDEPGESFHQLPRPSQPDKPLVE